MEAFEIELAGDYLVMAAWLTYLKSRLLLPKEEIEDEYTSDELEEALKYQLKRLDGFLSEMMTKRINRALQNVVNPSLADRIVKKYTFQFIEILWFFQKEN